MLHKKILSLAKSRLVKESGVYTLFNVIERLIPFLLLPVYTRFLDPYEYGIYATFQALTVFFLPILSLNTNYSIVRNYYLKDKINFPEYFSNSFFLFFFVFFISTIIILFFSDEIGRSIEFPAEWLIAIILYCFLRFFNLLHLSLYQVERKPASYGVNKLLITLTSNIFSLILIVLFSYGWKGLIIGQMSSLLIFALFSIFYFYRNSYFKFRYNKGYINDALKIGGPLTLHGLGAWLNSLSGRIILNSMIGAAATGNYSVGASIGMIIVVLQDSFNKAYTPFLFEKLTNITSSIKNKLVKYTYAYHIFLFTIALAVGLLGEKFAPLIFGIKYVEASKFILWVSLAYAFNGMYKMHVNYILFAKKTYFVSLITLISGIVNVAACFILININGAIGVAQALFVGYLTSFILSWYFGNRVYPLNWNILKAI